MTVPPTGQIGVFTDVERTGFPFDPDNLAHPAVGDPVLLVQIGLLRNATAKGRAGVLLRIDLPDGRTVIAQTTWRLLHNAVKALAASPVASEETS